jgi:hypothetical protein
MQEVAITLRFNRVCLGAARRRRNGQTIFCFDRDPDGRVMFMPAAWLSCMRYAAKLYNRFHTDVKNIDWCPLVMGTPKPDWRRTIISNANKEDTRAHFAVHEAFKPGDKITLSAVLPQEIGVEDFTYMLTIVGKYRGFSPFNNNQEKYGTFEVISVDPIAGPGSE